MTNRKYKKYLPYFAWTIALVALIGSLILSEVLKFPPCVLCWYQRIAVYPQVVLIGIGILMNTTDYIKYSLPLLYLGALIGIYHNLLYYGILPESAEFCSSGISCTTRYIEILGFITIPLLSLSAIILLITCLLIIKKARK